MDTPRTVTITGPAWSLDLAPEIGAGLVAARARVGDGWHTVTRAVDLAAIASGDVRNLAGFPMVPYFNRLDGGRFTYEGRVVRVALNWPADPTVSIHGIGWQRPWTIGERSETRLVLEQLVDDGADGFAYAARLVCDVTADWRLTLAVENRARRRLPFGLGYHPYLRRAPGAEIAFHADGRLEHDARVMPTAWTALSPPEDASHGRPVAAFDGLDGSFTGWGGNVRLTFPDLGAALALECARPGRILHLYVPTGGEFLCVEPATHVTDVANRRQFASYGDMTPLAPGEAMELAMVWRTVPI